MIHCPPHSTTPVCACNRGQPVVQRPSGIFCGYRETRQLVIYVRICGFSKCEQGATPSHPPSGSASSVDCIRRARDCRQVVLITHNPNLAIVCDADQIISFKIDKASCSLITYESGAIENPKINVRSIDVLEGTFPEFDNRRLKWMKPQEPAA